MNLTRRGNKNNFKCLQAAVNYTYLFRDIIAKAKKPFAYQCLLYIFSLLLFCVETSTAQAITVSNGAVAIISSSTTVRTTGDINIAPGGSIKNNGSIQLNGSWKNDGSFSDNNGTIIFSAETGGKTIGGFLAGANKFNNVIFNGIGGAWTFDNDAEVGANLSLVSGDVTAPAGILTLDGDITQTATRFFHNNGLVVFEGSLAQSYKATTPLTFFDLTNNNSFGLPGLSVDNDLIIERELKLLPLSKLSLVSGDIILRSTSANTANVANVPAEPNIIMYGAGRFIIERYINIGTSSEQHGKSWQLLAAPAAGETIKQTWMEGAGTNANPNPGYGTQITGLGGASNGFDAPSNDPSMKYYSPASNTWIGVGDPATTAINNNQGYFLFVRGDRSVINFSGANSSPLPTTLRTKGTLLTGTIPGPSVTAGLFQSVGNPYASSIDLRNLSFGSGINSTVIVWDPTIGGAHGLGAFQTLFLSGGNYLNLLSSTGYGPAGTTHNFIQSGQAFIIQAVNAGGTLTFKESDKSPGSNILFTQPSLPENSSQLRTILYNLNADSTFLSDGVLLEFNKIYSNAFNETDARKMINSSENLSIKSGGKYLVLERRKPVVQSDTIFYNLTGLKARHYRLEFITNNQQENEMQGFVEDTYLHSKTLLNTDGATDIDFNVSNITASSAADRFRIVFQKRRQFPFIFTSVKAYAENKNINIKWSVENEMNIRQYEVEKSTDALLFTTIAIQTVTGTTRRSSSYLVADVNSVAGYNYYKAKSIDINGKVLYTNVVKVLIANVNRDIKAVPNPVTDGIIRLQFIDQPEGKYSIRLLNTSGQLILFKRIGHSGGSNTELIKLNYSMPHGIYQLEINRPDGSIKNINVTY